MKELKEMRDRLIELIDEKQVYGIDQYQPESHNTYLLDNDELADHLLAEGVIVPPVKLGSNLKVYIPVSGTTTVLETKVFGIGVDEDGDIVINPTVYSTETIEINGYNIGKTVFLTREEAEKSLAERKENGT